MYVLLWRSLVKDHLSGENSAQTCKALYLRSCPLDDALVVSVVSIWVVCGGKLKGFPHELSQRQHEDVQHLKPMTNFLRLRLMRLYKVRKGGVKF